MEKVKTQKQLLQDRINTFCINEMDAAKKELYAGADVKSRRLRACSAIVYNTNNYYILQSYNTIIAVINKHYDILSDGLRIVYGFTHTSAQHVAKFNSDYGSAKYGARGRITARYY